MTYLKRQTEIQEKLSTHRAGIAECELEMSELFLDMANKIENLEDELRFWQEQKYIKDAYGD